jgi:ABC-2 type transport system permease protein
MKKIIREILIRVRIASISFVNEIKAAFTDGGALLILFGAAIVYPIAYSIAYKNNVLRDIPVAVVDLDKTATSRQITRMIDATDKISIACKPASLREAEDLFWDGKVKGIILVEKDFEQSIFKGKSANLGVYCDASYFLLYKETLSATLLASSTFSAGVEIKRYMSGGSSLDQALEQYNPLHAQYVSLYNPAGSYGSYVMPGIIIVILQQTLLIGIGMISGASREKRTHFVMPGLHFKGGGFSTIIGKSLSYFCIALLTTSFTLVWVYDWFGFPSKCNYFEVIALIIPYAFSTIFLGLAISFLFHKREQSIMFLVFLSPIVLFMSGLSWPAESMPLAVHWLASLMPSTFMVPAYLRVRTMGVGLSNVRGELTALYIQTIVYLLLAVVFYKIMKSRQIKSSIKTA